MQVLQDIAAIAKKALDESNNVTESDVAPILSDALEAIVELCQMEQDYEKHIVAYPSVWLAPAYRFGQSVIALCGNGECLSLVVGMRFGAFPDSLKIGGGLFWHRQQEWRYQIVEIENGVPDQHCDGRWYPEAVLSHE